MKCSYNPRIENIQIVTCTGIQDSTLDETFVYVHKPHANIPYITRRYNPTKASLARIQRLNLHSRTEMKMTVCNWHYDNYTDPIMKIYERD